MSQVTFSEESDLFKVTIIRKVKPVFQLAKVSICLCAWVNHYSFIPLELTLPLVGLVPCMEYKYLNVSQLNCYGGSSKI